MPQKRGTVPPIPLTELIVLTEITIAVVLIATMVAMPIWMVRGLIRAYRDTQVGPSSSSGMSGVLNEFDRIVRPSIQHVIELKDEVSIERDDIGGE